MDDRDTVGWSLQQEMDQVAAEDYADEMWDAYAAAGWDEER